MEIAPMKDIENVVLKDGVLHKPVAGSPGRLKPFLPTPEISVVDKLGSVPAGNGGTKFVFRFRLSESTCEEWQALFKQNVADNRVAVLASELTVTCEPAELEQSYSAVRTAIPETNRAYAERQRSVLERVRARDALKLAEEEKRQKADYAAKSALKSLTL
jgi:hypothetical protein